MAAAPPPPRSTGAATLSYADDAKNARWSFGREPIWLHPVFADLFFDPMQPTPLRPRPLAAGAFMQSMDLLSAVYSNIISQHSSWLSALAHHEMAAFTLMLPVIAEAKSFSNR